MADTMMGSPGKGNAMCSSLPLPQPPSLRSDSASQGYGEFKSMPPNRRLHRRLRNSISGTGWFTC